MIQNLLLLLNAVVAIALVLVILLQRQDTSGGGIMGGANMGAAPVMRNPLAKVTAWLAAIFMGSSLVLAVLSSGSGKITSVFDNAPAAPSVTVEEPAEVVPTAPEELIPPIPDPMPEATQ